MKLYGKGESGGLRIISYHVPSEPLIVPALIYAKSELENPPHKLLIEITSEIRDWLMA
ncbi:MAG: hypothetical protein WAW37_20635 [Syntrophobacteraceae bacterium]